MDGRTYAKKVLLVSDWEGTLRKLPEEDDSDSSITLNKGGLFSRLKQLKETNRKLKIKNLILETQILRLQEHLNSINVIFLLI